MTRQWKLFWFFAAPALIVALAGVYSVSIALLFGLAFTQTAELNQFEEFVRKHGKPVSDKQTEAA